MGGCPALQLISARECPLTGLPAEWLAPTGAAACGSGQGAAQGGAAVREDVLPALSHLIVPDTLGEDAVVIALRGRGVKCEALAPRGPEPESDDEF
jgi:hypothetical protein